ncbi:MAG: hypothetical protein H6552_03410 [Chitinophagales bacterium]|nr:hypothetical protein [Chitinophagales bacterium]
MGTDIRFGTVSESIDFLVKFSQFGLMMKRIKSKNSNYCTNWCKSKMVGIRI